MNREEPLSDLNLWFAATLPGFCVLFAERSVPSVAPTPRWGAAAVATRDSVAYLTSCPARRRPASFVELGVNGHGPDARDLMDRLVDQLRIWDTHHRHGPGPSFQVYPAGDDVPAGFRITRRHGCFVVNWTG